MFNQMSTLILGLIMISVSPLDAANPVPQRHWPRWRGPSDSGSALHGSPPVHWSDTDNVMWKSTLPGVGRSTPIVWDDHILLTCPIDGEDAVMAYDWKGQLTWNTTVGKARKGKHRNGSGCNSSPVTDGSHVFAYFRSGNLAGLDLNGDLLWKTNLQERFGEDRLWWDIGTSPVVTDQHVVVAVMHGDDSYLMAVDKLSGKLRWKVPRIYETPLEGDHSYATPIVVRRDNQQLILVWGAEHLTAHSAKDGRVIWSCGGFNPDKNSNWVAVASFVVAGDVVVVPYGRGERLAGIRLGGTGDVTHTHRLWTRHEAGSFVPTPSADGQDVFVLRDAGEVVCIDANTGQTKWEGRLPRHRAKYYASPVVVAGRLYAAREDGAMFVAEISGQFKTLATNDVKERVIASPVPIGDRLLIRGERQLFCIGTE